MPRIQMPNSGKVLRRSAVGIEGVNMKVELTDSEVRGIGERRWLRGHWKWLAVWGAISVVVVVLVMEIKPEGLTTWVNFAILLAALLPYGIGCSVWVRKQDKAGKRLLAERQGEEKEGQSQEQ